MTAPEDGATGSVRLLRFRQVGNVLNLSTPCGLLLAGLGRARLRRGPDGLLIAEGYRWRFPIAGAFTVGNVVLTRSPRLNETLLRHEARHAWQWVACGQVFLPAYTAALAWSWLRTGDLAAANPFERLAGLAEGGYRTDVTARPLLARRPQQSDGTLGTLNDSAGALSDRSVPRRPRRRRRPRPH